MTAGLEEMDLGPEWVDVVDMATQTISKFNCGICDRNYRDSYDLQRHVKLMHKTRYHTQDSVTFREHFPFTQNNADILNIQVGQQGSPSQVCLSEGKV